MTVKYKVLIITPEDNVGVALTDLQPGEEVLARLGNETTTVQIQDSIPFGHKMALCSLTSGARVIKYGQTIGRTTASVAVGQHVHVHNIEGLRGRGDQAMPEGGS